MWYTEHDIHVMRQLNGTKNDFARQNVIDLDHSKFHYKNLWCKDGQNEDSNIVITK